jgi:hypothetical protein
MLYGRGCAALSPSPCPYMRTGPCGKLSGEIWMGLGSGGKDAAVGALPSVGFSPLPAFS